MVEPGTQIGRYEIQRKLGGGGMGTVYVAHDPVLGRMVAIKMFKADIDLPDAGHRFSREARSAAALNHPNIVTVYDFGDIESQPYIVMEYVAGEALSQLIHRKAVVTLSDKLRWLEELCAGAAYAHRMSVVHRDLKPANLMIDKSGRLKILDFGIARMAGTASTTAAMTGTPGYMAPEQFRGETLDQRADVFAIGAVFYELISFTEAFPGESLATVMHRVLTVDPPPLRDLLVDCHPDIAFVCEKALMKDRDQRFASADEMRESISRIRGELDADAGLTIFPAPRPEAPAAPVVSAGTGSAAPARETGGQSVTSAASGSLRRTDREALARRRKELLDGAVQDARAELQRGRPEQALAACQRALAIDETHPEALNLEEQIQAALGASSGAGGGMDLFGDDALTVAPSDARVGRAPVEDRTVLRIPTDQDRTVLVHPRATPVPAPSAPMPVAPPLEPTAAAHKAPAPASPARQPAATAGAKAASKSAPQPPWLDAARAFARARPRAVLIGAGATALAAIAAIGMLMNRGPAPTGILVVDAVPWARITAIETASGSPVEVPDLGSTPLRLSLPAGSYRITVAGPGQEKAQLEGTVSVDGINIVQAPPFRSITVEEYFEQYLTPPETPDASAGARP